MHDISIIDASDKFDDVAALVSELLVELEPSAKLEVEKMELQILARELMESEKIWGYLAVCNGKSVAVITLHECAALYAGGVFGEISELYVKPEFRSANIGELLINSAIKKGRALGWKRLEVGTPPYDESPRTTKFYQNKGFVCTGSRMKFIL